MQSGLAIVLSMLTWPILLTALTTSVVWIVALVLLARHRPTEAAAGPSADGPAIERGGPAASGSDGDQPVIPGTALLR